MARISDALENRCLICGLMMNSYSLHTCPSTILHKWPSFDEHEALTFGPWGRKVVLLNGPPGCGKDTIGRILCDLGMCEMLAFKGKLFDIALNVSGISKEDWFERYNDRELKELPWERIGDLSQRQFLIKISEEWLKPTFDDGYFGRAAAEAIDTLDSEKDVVFTDSGFQKETDVLIAHGYEVHVIHLRREGYSFDGDSRNYLTGYDRTYDIELINGEPYVAAGEIIKLVWGK